jgi:hypothetical protein
VVVPEASGENARGFRVRYPFVHTLGVAKGGEPFEQADEPFAPAPVPLTE